ncbi:hypothetical protein [Stygiolobus sp. RP850M]|uniref:hypothetical protein n=1 Tax=Stygiolobus sp. RP850M TaxID=3133137 RepID=UPI00307E5B11
MVCEFLPVEYKRRLLQIATIEELQKVGYTKRTDYKAKEKGVISDDSCEELVRILGRRAKCMLKEALEEFENGVNVLYEDIE